MLLPLRCKLLLQLIRLYLLCLQCMALSSSRALAMVAALASAQCSKQCIFLLLCFYCLGRAHLQDKEEQQRRQQQQQ
jgi:hypothetical protein